MSQLRTVWII